MKTCTPAGAGWGGACDGAVQAWWGGPGRCAWRGCAGVVGGASKQVALVEPAQLLSCWDSLAPARGYGPLLYLRDRASEGRDAAWYGSRRLVVCTRLGWHAGHEGKSLVGRRHGYLP